MLVPGIPGTFSSAVMLMAHIKSLAPLLEFMTCFVFIETFYPQSEMDEKIEFGSFYIADSQKSEIVLKE